MGTFIEKFPPNTAITWADVWRFTGNNVIPKKTRERYMRQHWDAGRCLYSMAQDLHGNYFPANYYTIVTKYNMTEPQYYAIVETLAQEAYERRKLVRDDESLDYWRFCFNNCLKLLEEYLSKC